MTNPAFEGGAVSDGGGQEDYGITPQMVKAGLDTLRRSGALPYEGSGDGLVVIEILVAAEVARRGGKRSSVDLKAVQNILSKSLRYL